MRRHLSRYAKWFVGVGVLTLLACEGAVGPNTPSSLPLAFTITASESAGATENDALGRAFDKVNKYRVVVTDALTLEVLADTVVAVPNGLTAHTLDIQIPESALGRMLRIEIVAFEGETELFRTEAAAAVEGGSEQKNVEVPVRYTGPGLRGSVADLAGGGLSGVTVSLLQNGGLVEETTTASDGSFLFIDLTPGDFVVRPTVTGNLEGCPGERAVSLENSGESLVAAFVLREGSCGVRVLVVSGGDVDDTGAAAAELGGDSDIEVSTFFLVSSLPGVDQLKQYDVVLLYSNGLFNESSALGDQIASFVSLGGNVVFGSFYWQVRNGGGKETTGWGGLEGIDAFSSAGGAVYTSGSLGSVTDHALTHGVGSLSSSGFRGGAVAKGGTTVVASWSDGAPLVGYKTLSAGQRMVGVSLFPAHSGVGGVSGDTGQLWKNAVRFAGAAGGPARVGVVAGGN